MTKEFIIKPPPKEKDTRQLFEESGYRAYTDDFYKLLHISEAEIWQGITNTNWYQNKTNNRSRNHRPRQDDTSNEHYECYW